MASVFTLYYLWQISVISLMQYTKALIEIYRRLMVINLYSAPFLKTTAYSDLDWEILIHGTVALGNPDGKMNLQI